ncbi:MAG: hypothetical protein P8O87_00430 [Crocinitomicaceae bacterium]|nr:hypothetical protein [Crocinitomicaceae bacterium]
MKWIGNRISFVDDASKTTIVIYAKDIGWMKGAMGAWVAMWFMLGIAVSFWGFASEQRSDQEYIVVSIFLAFWLYYALKVSRSWFWFMWGKELIKIDEASLYYKKSIRKYGKSIPYLLENVSKLKLYTPDEKSFQAAWEKSPWIIGGERLEFEYLEKTVRIGLKLDTKDATLLFKLLSKRIEKQIKMNQKRQSL